MNLCMISCHARLISHHETVIEKKANWSSEENKMFENALTEVDPTSQSFFEDIASKIPRKTMDEIKNHYQALIEDVEMIECGEIPIPNYKSFNDVTRDHNINYQKEKYMEMEKKKDNSAGGSSPANAASKTRQSRQKGVPWTEEEHRLFLMGLNRYGKGDWRSISIYYVITKTSTQVASHAQKYFKRQTSTTPIGRRRPSIHDIKTVNPITSTMPQIRHTHDQGGNKIQESPLILRIVSANSHIINPSLNLHDYPFNVDGSTKNNNSKMFTPISYSSMFSSTDPILNQASSHVANHPQPFAHLRR